MLDTEYGFTRTLKGISYEDARRRIEAALKAEGFGVLTEIDVRATLRAKLNVDFPNYVILGACNPTLAHQALSTDRELGSCSPAMSWSDRTMRVARSSRSWIRRPCSRSRRTRPGSKARCAKHANAFSGRWARHEVNGHQAHA